MKVLKIIFIVICLLFLLLPLVLFDFHSEISIEENKMLQRFPKLFNNRELNKNFRTELVSYVDDRFGAKKTFRRIYSSTIEPIAPKRTGNVVGGDGFVFSMDEIEAFLNVADYSDEDVETAIRVIKKKQEYCNKNGIKLIVLIAPYKHNVYPDKVPYQQPEGETLSKRIVNKAKEEGLDIIYPVEYLRKERNRMDYPIYYATDNHWTNIGAECVFEEYILPGLKAISFNKMPSEFEYSYFFCKSDDVNDKKETNKINSKTIGWDVIPKTGIWNDYYTTTRYVENHNIGGDVLGNFYHLYMTTESKFNPNGPKAIVFRDSFFHYDTERSPIKAKFLAPFVSSYFSKVDYVWTAGRGWLSPIAKKNTDEYISDFKPDVIIWEMYEEYVPYLTNENNIF